MPRARSAVASGSLAAHECIAELDQLVLVELRGEFDPALDGGDHRKTTHRHNADASLEPMTADRRGLGWMARVTDRDIQSDSALQPTGEGQTPSLTAVAWLKNSSSPARTR